MKVKCEFCGNYLEDTLEKCPNCGAMNVNHMRAANDTPRTIADLRNWYAARNLPAPEITRFFIGVDYKEPKAFGIYQEGSEFIVYKNKADGERAIRYRGTDEAYAVNEIYMKLKEEILHQKSLNADRQNSGASTGASSRSRRNPILARIKFFLIFAAALLLFGCISNAILLSSLIKTTTGPQRSYYYNSSTDELYFCYGKETSSKQYEWWKYDFENQKWSSFQTRKFPANIKRENQTGLYELSEQDPARFADIDIYSDRDYIDSGHHSHPNGNSYYVYDNNIYYYLDDSHYGYGDRNNSGWYIYDDDEWVYYCDSEDLDKLGADLWYEPDRYSTGYRDFYEFSDGEKSEWVSSFDDTDFYAAYTENEEAFENYEVTHPSHSYSNDSNYNWDSGSSWDSGGTNWDTDW